MQTTVLKDLSIAVVATLILPLTVLALDYFIRAKIQEGTWNDLVQHSGPDCCVLSLGATGALFVDPHVKTIAGIGSPLFVIALVLFLLFMRVACIQKANDDRNQAPSTLRHGITSLLSIFFVIVISYMVQIIK